MKWLTGILLLFVSGCSIWSPRVAVPQVEVVTVAVQPTIFQPPLPPPLRLEQIQWFVITESNHRQQLDKISKLQGNDAVVFAMMPSSYENLAYNVQEMRRYILQLLEVIHYYQQVTNFDNDP